MPWLAVTESQKADVQALNAASPNIWVNVVRGKQGGWLANADALPDAVPGGYLAHFADWYASLTPADDTPAPRPTRKK